MILKEQLHSEVFPTLNKEILPLIKADQNAPVPAEMTLRRRTNINNDNQAPLTFHGNTMRGRSIDHCLESVCPDIHEIISSLVDCLRERLENIVSDPLFTAAATLLDSKSYSSKSVEDIVSAAMVIVDQFKNVLITNRFQEDLLSEYLFIFY